MVLMLLQLPLILQLLAVGEPGIVLLVLVADVAVVVVEVS